MAAAYLFGCASQPCIVMRHYLSNDEIGVGAGDALWSETLLATLLAACSLRAAGVLIMLSLIAAAREGNGVRITGNGSRNSPALAEDGVSGARAP
jgi:hypothetical protein